QLLPEAPSESSRRPTSTERTSNHVEICSKSWSGRAANTESRRRSDGSAFKGLLLSMSARDLETGAGKDEREVRLGARHCHLGVAKAGDELGQLDVEGTGKRRVVGSNDEARPVDRDGRLDRALESIGSDHGDAAREPDANGTH